jgi:hypothetical protein
MRSLGAFSGAGYIGLKMAGWERLLTPALALALAAVGAAALWLKAQGNQKSNVGAAQEAL